MLRGCIFDISFLHKSQSRLTAGSSSVSVPYRLFHRSILSRLRWSSFVCFSMKTRERSSLLRYPFFACGFIVLPTTWRHRNWIFPVIFIKGTSDDKREAIYSLLLWTHDCIYRKGAFFLFLLVLPLSIFWGYCLCKRSYVFRQEMDLLYKQYRNCRCTTPIPNHLEKINQTITKRYVRVSKYNRINTSFYPFLYLRICSYDVGCKYNDRSDLVSR